MARDWKARQPPAQTSITEVARRYHAAALALGQTLGLSLAEVLTQHRESVTAIFIECGRCDLRLPAAVKLPPLAAPTPAPEIPAAAAALPVNGDHAAMPEAARISRDQARDLKKAAQAAYGFSAGEARLRQDLGLADDARLTLMRVAAHTTAAQYATLREAYEAALRETVEADVS